MTTPQRLPLVSVEDYLAAEEKSDIRHEYTGGYVHAMAGGKYRHNQVSSNILIALGSRLRGAPCQALNPDAKVRIRAASGTSFYYPDAMVVCEPNPGNSVYEDRPVIVVEVLSDSTRRQDSYEKRDAYLTIPSLKAYLLVEPDEAKVSVYRRQADGAGLEAFEAQLYTGRDAIIPLDEIEVDLPLAEVYERVEFEA
jgi:Uma2 family endonuclease